MSNTKNSPLPNVSTFSFDSNYNTSLFTKNNFIVDLEEWRTSSNKISMNTMQWMMIQTALYMTQQLKDKHKSYIFDANTKFSITLEQFSSLWNIQDIDHLKKTGAIYNDIRRSLSNLRAIKLRYPEYKTNKPIESGYFSSIGYDNHEFTFTFPREIADYIKSIGNYTWYFFGNIIKLKDNTASSMLYEQFNKHKYMSNQDQQSKQAIIEIEVEKLKKLLAPNRDLENKIFKRDVLVPAIKFINENTTMSASLSGTTKKGRFIDKYIFAVMFDEEDFMFKKATENEKNKKPYLNDDQRTKFAFTLSTNVYFIAFAKKDNEQEYDFFNRVKLDLKDNEYVENIYKAFLVDAGYKNKYIEAKLDARPNEDDIEPETPSIEEDINHDGSFVEDGQIINYKNVQGMTDNISEYMPSNEAYKKYIKIGGTLSIDEIQKHCEEKQISASKYLLSEITKLKKEKTNKENG